MSTALEHVQFLCGWVAHHADSAKNRPTGNLHRAARFGTITSIGIIYLAKVAAGVSNDAQAAKRPSYTGDGLEVLESEYLSRNVGL
jgi:hypothetical protein